MKLASQYPCFIYHQCAAFHIKCASARVPFLLYFGALLEIMSILEFVSEEIEEFEELFKNINLRAHKHHQVMHLM